MFQSASAAFHNSSNHNNILNTLQMRFTTLWERCLSNNKTLGNSVFSKLTTLYSEPFRQYHNFNHICYCLRQFDQCTQLMDEPDAVELGLWFHDAIYVVGAKDNERRSADLFCEYATHAGCNIELQQRIAELIMNTTHNAQPCCNDGQFIMDIDVSGFGQSWDNFMEDGARLRAEAAAMEDQVYYTSLLHFMRSLSTRQSFFFTAYFQQHYEQNAQNNMRRLIADLTMRSYA